MARFPKEIEDFGNLFVELQGDRHRADYDIEASFTLSDALEVIDAAERAILPLRCTAIKDRRAFAVWTAMKLRRA